MKHLKKSAVFGRKRLALVLSLLLIFAVTITGTVAYFVDMDSSKSSFAIGNVSVAVDKDENANLPTYTISNEGNVDAYVRVKIIANWATDSTTVLFGDTPPAFDVSNGWHKDGDFYYYGTSATDWTLLTAETGFTSLVVTPKADNKPTGATGVSITVIAEASADADLWN